MSYVSEQAHTSTEATISIKSYNKMRLSAIGLGLALIVIVLYLFFNQPKIAPSSPLPKEVWLEDQLDITLPPEMVEKLRNVYGIKTVVFINGKGEIRVTEPDAKRRDVCADLQGTEIVERPGQSCGLKGITPRYFQQILYFAHNPGCTSAGGKLGC